MRLTQLPIAICALATLGVSGQATHPATLLSWRQPNHVVLAPDGRSFTLIVGDSLLVARTDGSGMRLVSRGVLGEASYGVPFIAWSPDASQIVFRRARGTATENAPGASEVAYVADVTGRHPPHPLLPDSVGRTLALFQNYLAGGPAWSPDGRHVALLAHRTDDTTSALQVHVANVQTGALEAWTSGAPKLSLAWSKDGRWLAVTSGDFGGRAGTIEMIDTRSATHASHVVVRDSAAYFVDLRWSPSGKRLIALDNRRRARVLNVDASGQVTAVPNALPALRYQAWLSDSVLLTTVSRTPHDMSSQLAAVELATGVRHVLSGADTNVSVVGVIRGARPTVVHTRTSGAMPKDVWAATVREDFTLERARQLSTVGNAVPVAQRPVSRIVRWTSPMGDTLEAQLLLPRSTGKRVPLVVVPYGSYRNEFLRGEYFLDRGLLTLIDEGWAVVLPNTRGTATDRRDVGRYGAMQLEDTERLLDMLAADSVIDARRIAVIGHSHGGAMTYYYATHSQRFCAAVAVAGRADWAFQAHYGSDGLLPGIMGGTPEERPEAYKAASPVEHADAVNIPMLGVAGEHDTQILPENVRRMAAAMSKAGRKLDTLIYPDEGHLIENPAHVAELWTHARQALQAGCVAR